MGTFQIKNGTTGFSSRMREKFQRQSHLHKSFIFVEDKSRKYEFVDNNFCWVPESPLIERRQLLQADEAQLRQACKLLCQRIERGGIVAPEPRPQAQSQSRSQQPKAKTKAKTNNRLNGDNHHSTVRKESDVENNTNCLESKQSIAENRPSERMTTERDDEANSKNSLPVINELLRASETDLQESQGENATEKRPAKVGASKVNNTQSPAPEIEKKKFAESNLVATISQKHSSSALDDDSSPQHIEESTDPLTSTATAPDTYTYPSLEKKPSLMRRLSVLPFGKRKILGLKNAVEVK